jgi:3-oxoadipate enol-lactonase
VHSARRRASALYCAIHGRGTPLLLLHGIGATGAMFEPLIATLAARYQVLVPDLRGHGRSSCLPGPDSIARMAADLVDLLDLLHIPACYVLGYGTGGVVAQQLAHDHPQRVRGLALVCSYARRAATLREQIESRQRPELFRLLGARGMGVLAARRAPMSSSGFVRDVVAANRGTRVAPAARALLSFDSRAWLSALACPAIIIAGARDSAATPQHARELAQALPNASLHMLPEAGHWLVKTHSEALLATLMPWLTAQEVRV